MWSRKRLDIGLGDLAAGAALCLRPGAAEKAATRVEALGGDGAGDTLACLSVRSGFDLLLAALGLPAGAEVLMSAITVPGMVRVVEAHGLVPVPVDLDPSTAAADPRSLRRALSPASRLLLVAHLYGGRPPLDPLLAIAGERRLRLIEDCAQAYAGDGWCGDRRADASLFSFGPIKTATALGGALATVRDPALLAAMRRGQSDQRRQGRGAFLGRVVKYAALWALSGRTAYGALFRLLEALGRDPDRSINRLAKSFPGADFLDRIRRRPSLPLLALLERRLRRYGTGRPDRRAAAAGVLLDLLRPAVACPGAAAPEHTFWVFPVRSEQPPRTLSALRQAGFDATQGDSLVVVEPPPGRPDLEPVAARRMLAETVYVPCYPEMPLAALLRLAEVLLADAAQGG